MTESRRVREGTGGWGWDFVRAESSDSEAGGRHCAATRVRVCRW